MDSGSAETTTAAKSSVAPWASGVAGASAGVQALGLAETSSSASASGVVETSGLAQLPGAAEAPDTAQASGSAKTPGICPKCKFPRPSGEHHSKRLCEARAREADNKYSLNQVLAAGDKVQGQYIKVLPGLNPKVGPRLAVAQQDSKA